MFDTKDGTNRFQPWTLIDKDRAPPAQHLEDADKKRIGETLKLKPELHSKLVSMTMLNLPEHAICVDYMHWVTAHQSHNNFGIMISNEDDWKSTYGLKPYNYLFRTLIATGQPSVYWVQTQGIP